MFDILADNILLTLFVVIALGTAFGAIPFGPLRFGAAGALFVGLGVGAFVSVPAEQLSIFQDLGLGLFVYMVGLEAGLTFFKEFRQQLGMMGASLVAVTIGAVIAIIGGELLGISRTVAVGVFSGALTSTPSLALAQEQSGSDLPAVGYSLGYPTGVILAILLVAFTIGRSWQARNEQEGVKEKILHTARVAVTREVAPDKLRDRFSDQIRIATVHRNGRTLIVDDSTAIQPGDVVTLMAPKTVLPDVTRALGRRVTPRLFRDPHVALQRFTVSNDDIVGNTIKDIPLYAEHRSRITRIRRADEDILPCDDTVLEYGDIVEVVLPAPRQNDLETYFGDSIRGFSQLDWVALAGGLAIGFIFALIRIPLPAGASFVLGAAAGPLIAGLILGAVQRTGRTSWQIPRPANSTLRQFGLMMFLAAVGIASGPAFAATAFTAQGVTALALAIVVSLAGCGSFLLLTWLLGKSSTRANGGVSGLLGQPAVLQYALENSSDSRIMSGYTATFAIALIYKIVVIPFMFIV